MTSIFDIVILCTVSKSKQVQISVVRCEKAHPAKNKKSRRIGLEDQYVRTEVWALHELMILDGRDPDTVSQTFPRQGILNPGL